jgi:hypothetical protein
MKSMKKIRLFVITLAVISLFSNCGKKGCLDGDANNICKNCRKKDNAQCAYTGDVTFYFKKPTADSLAAYGITSLTYYVDGELAGTTSTSSFQTSEPSCGANGTVSFKKDLKGNKSVATKYVAKTNGGIEIKGDLTFEANTCTRFELRW